MPARHRLHGLRFSSLRLAIAPETAGAAVTMAFFMTFFEIFDIPVFWPILLLYFIALFFLTMKRQIMHMYKHRYVPWSSGKAKYKGKSASADK